MSQVLQSFLHGETPLAGDLAAGALPLAVSVFADRAHIRAEIAEDAEAAGLRLSASGALEDLVEGEARPLGEVILVDVPVVGARSLAALARIDMRAAHSEARLVVSTSLAALDDVFGCLDQSGAQILVAPSRAERVIALGRVLAEAPRGRVRELSDGDRLTLLRLTEQVGHLAERLEQIAGPGEGRSAYGGAFRFESPVAAFSAADPDAGDRLVRAARPSLPDPRLVRRIIRQRQLRGRFFEGDLFADPAWDMLLDLTAARAEHTRVSVTSLCIASGVPPTTALRWIGQMTEAGLLERVEDPTDRRRAFITLTDRAADAMARYFAELGKGAQRLA
ncbi:winged helix DNA-binding protein [Novosphingobium tardum]|uniref:Winged helix DNA-binding protein n=1 Tax=Novosphingobium tardum TaxID=1538021 RepID=A0ABV8RNT1_9SPHN